ncbi:movement protein [Luteovirus sociomali]|uniref:Movement protein n=1 Tax=Luteovirus sociomali TaxID=2054409 RepID=A0A2H4QXD9_9TOMB|nr:movement protein [Luteovirus sociomali]ATY36306.1 movement protein [Luteovirus sociomali]
MAGESSAPHRGWLWSPVLEDDEEMVDQDLELTELEVPALHGRLRSSLSQWTTYAPMQAGSLSSGPAYRSALQFQAEYSSPTLSIKSSVSRSSMSRMPPAPLRAHSLLRSTLPALEAPLTLGSSPSQFPRTTPARLMRLSSRDSRGSLPLTTNSTSSIRGMARQTSLGSSSSEHE